MCDCSLFPTMRRFSVALTTLPPPCFTFFHGYISSEATTSVEGGGGSRIAFRKRAMTAAQAAALAAHAQVLCVARCLPGAQAAGEAFTKRAIASDADGAYSVFAISKSVL